MVVYRHFQATLTHLVADDEARRLPPIVDGTGFLLIEESHEDPAGFLGIGSLTLANLQELQA